MQKNNFERLCAELKPFLQREEANMRMPISVECQVAATLYYLSDEGRMRKTPNAFGISRSSVSVRRANDDPGDSPTAIFYKPFVVPAAIVTHYLVM